ncbi:hypothetical protein HRI_000273300 [Hibiscus trionum]|uniref:MADS-box domain-containing protein n=1 Tax=Hibiscus trionum TaxID=183268 RepID=A0A9W7GY63_HIBTR|nr:hypothetical protein HRI_000273300 [Hibiscus trionum]
MGRVKVEMKRIENKTYRHITFAKRKSGLVKKAYELSTLCNVDLALLIFSPAGKLFLFDSNKRIEEVFARYIELPARRRGWVENQEVVRRIITQMSLEAGYYDRSTVYRSNKDIATQLKEIQNEMLICSTQLEDVERQLQHFLRNPGCLKSMNEATYYEIASLEANRIVQPTSNEFGVTIVPSQNPFVGRKAMIPPSLNYNWMNCDLQAPRIFTDEYSNGFQQLSRNLAPPITYLHLQGHYMYCPSPNFPPRNTTIIQQARAGARGSEAGNLSGTGSNLDSDVWFLH